jgi:predicted RNA-binding Zn-ribbon protein involved in translation (DUF1610 family)
VVASSVKLRFRLAVGGALEVFWEIDTMERSPSIGSNKIARSAVFGTDEEVLMTSCQACGLEIIGRDRFCRKCGAPVPTLVADLVDTRHLNPNAPPSAVGGPGSHEFTAPFYAPPPAVMPQYQTGGIKKRFTEWKAVWLVMILFVSIVAAAAIGVSVNKNRRRPIATEPARRHSFPDAIRNGLGMDLANLPESEFPDLSGGMFVNNLMSDNSPAALAKPSIEAGDVLIELNGQAISNSREVAQALESLKPGTEVPAKIYRDGETLPTLIKVANPNFAPPLPSPRSRDQGLLGISDVGSRRYILSAKKWGVAIGEPSSNGPADLAGLQRGDIITEFDGHAIRTRDELERRIHAATPRSKVPVKFYRNGIEHPGDVLMGHR